MPIDRAAAENFIWSAARLLDRHRYALLFLGGASAPVLDALRGYRNPDGGFGHALEPDLRGPGSQPGPTLYALETLNEAGAADSELARGARAWIGAIVDPAGGIPAVVTGYKDYPRAPWWEPTPGSVLGLAIAAAVHEGAAADSRGTASEDANAGPDAEWIARATDWCWRSIEDNPAPAGYWLKFACTFLDAVPDAARAEAALEALASRVDPSAFAPAGGAEGEALRPLDLSPRPGTRSRRLVGDAEIEAHLDAVESEQQPDGGWMFDWRAWSPAQTTDWRGNVTVRALRWLRDNGRL